MEEKFVRAEETSSVNCATTVRCSSASWAKFRSCQNKQSFGERNELPQFLLTFCFAHLPTRIVVPQYQNSLVEMCHEAEVSLVENSLVA
jgi:hypothetical protein